MIDEYSKIEIEGGLKEELINSGVRFSVQYENLKEDYEKTTDWLMKVGEKVAEFGYWVSKIEFEVDKIESSIKMKSLEADPKLSEWKVKAKILANEEYQEVMEKFFETKFCYDYYYRVFHCLDKKCKFLLNVALVQKLIWNNLSPLEEEQNEE